MSRVAVTGIMLAVLPGGPSPTPVAAEESLEEGRCIRIGESGLHLSGTLNLKSDYLVVMGGSIEQVRKEAKAHDAYVLLLDSNICIEPADEAERQFGPYRNVPLLAINEPDQHLKKLLAKRVHSKVKVTATLTALSAIDVLSVR